MKRLIAFLLAAVMLFALAACDEAPVSVEEPPKEHVDEDNDATVAENSDLAYVREKGTLIVGITDLAPMDYKGDGDEWIGFDAEMAKIFADNLGVTAEFLVIDMGNREKLLEDKTVDCIWNAMILTDEVTAVMECSNAYCDNAQTVVVPKDYASKYQTIEDCKYLRFSVAADSAGVMELKVLGYAATTVEKAKDALLSVNQGTADAAVVDAFTAGAMVGSGMAFEKLTPVFQLSSEKYAVGFRKGSDLAEEVNVFFAAAYADGLMQQIARRYNVEAALISQRV